MVWIIRLFDNYIKFNFHVGLAVLALAGITALDFGFSFHIFDRLIFFVAPFLAYNFIKFHMFFFEALEFRIGVTAFLLGLIILAILLFFGVGLYLPASSYIILFFTFLLVVLYCLPLPGLKHNFRGVSGLKIHLVALSWVLTTVFLPLSIVGYSMTEFSLVYGFQRYLFLLVATLPFEIRDLKLDDPNLSTWPQKWGIKKTQRLGGLLLLLFVFLEIYLSISSNSLLVLGMAILLMGFVLFAKTEQSKYFSSFWVEGIPILWLILKCIII